LFGGFADFILTPFAAASDFSGVGSIKLVGSDTIGNSVHNLRAVPASYTILWDQATVTVGAQYQVNISAKIKYN
jgi:hypothetical protein